MQLILDREVLDWLSKNQLTLNLPLEKKKPKVYTFINQNKG